MSIQAAWLIGSEKSMSYSVTIAGSAQTISGNYYLYNATSSLSLLSAWVTAATAAGLASATAVLTQDRKVKIGNGANFTVTWTNTTFRDLLGFTGNLSGASSYTATNTSKLLWSPAKPLRPELSPWGTTGIERPLIFLSQSPNDGSTFAVVHGSRTDQRWSAEMVDTDRVFTSSEAGGEWVTFFATCFSLGYNFLVYRDVTEVDGGTTTATLSNPLGPYVIAPPSRSAGWDYVRSRGFEWVDKRANISISCRDAPEYT